MPRRTGSREPGFAGKAPSQSAPEVSGGLRPGCAPRATGSEPAQAHLPELAETQAGAREIPAAPGAKPEDKKKAKKDEAGEKGGRPLALTLPASTGAQGAAAAAHPPAPLARASTA